jgi:hypothetical protein
MDPHARATSIWYRIGGLISRRQKDLAVEILERRWQARQVKGADGTVRVAELVFHRGGRPIADFRKA